MLAMMHEYDYDDAEWYHHADSDDGDEGYDADVQNADCGHDYDANMMALLSTMLMHGDSRDVTLGSTGFIVEMWGVRMQGVVTVVFPRLLAIVANLIDLRVLLQFSSSNRSYWCVSRAGESQSRMQWH